MWRHKSPTAVVHQSSFQHPIGQPALCTTSYDEKLLETLPHVREALMLKRKLEADKSTRHSQLLPHYQLAPGYNSLAPRDRRVSQVPTASSVYSQSPETRFGFDDAPRIAPLFAHGKPGKPPTHQMVNIVATRRQSSIPVPKKQSSLPRSDGVATSSARPARLDRSGLGIDTRAPAKAHEWQGASGGTALLTPIAATPAQSERMTSPSVSPISDNDAERNRIPRIMPTPDSPDIQRRLHLPRVPEKSEHEMRPRLATDPTGGKAVMEDVFRNSPQSPSHNETANRSRFSWTTRADTELPSTPEQGMRPSMDDVWTAKTPSPGLLGSRQQQQPSSRFSWTTVATSVAQETPPRMRESRQPPLPHDGRAKVTAAAQTYAHIQSKSAGPQPPLTPPRAASADTATHNRYIFEDDTPPLAQQTWNSDSSLPLKLPYSPESPPRRPAGYLAPATQVQRKAAPLLSTSPGPTESPGSFHSPAALHNPRLRALADSEPRQTLSHLRNTPVRRKPTPSTLSQLDIGHDGSPSTFSNTDKALPPAPPQLDCVDMVTSLEAELESLSNRRLNLTKMITNLMAIDAMSPVSSSMQLSLAQLAATNQNKRKEDKERVKGFEDELADVRLKEHELGLRLHKAWKRREENVEKPSALWIRRTTT